MGQRIPHGESPVEVRQGFQRMESLVGVLSDGESGELLVGVAVNLNPVWQSVGTAIDHGAIGGLSDDDHALYSLADGTRDFTGVVVGIDPVLSNHLATKEYIDSNINFIFEYFLTGDASDIGGIYYDMLDTHTGGGVVDIDSVALSTGDGQALGNWATITTEPGSVLAHRGIHGLHFHAMKVSGTKPLRIYWELYLRETDTTETLIGTSEVSPLVPGVDTELDLHHTQAVDITMNDTDRFVIKLYANVGTTGSAVVVRLSVEGDTASHLNIPVSTETLSAIYLRQDGTKALTGNMSVDAAITIDGRDLSIDGTKLDTIETNADVTDTTNVAAAGAAMSGGAFHDGFSDYVGNEHVDHTGVTVTAGSGLAGTSDISANFTLDLDVNSLSAATIVAGDFVPFWDLTATATNKKTTFANFEAALTHDNLMSGTILSHDTTATGANLTSMTDDSMVDSLHRHSELSASDGTPNPALSVDAAGKVGIGITNPQELLHVGAGTDASDISATDLLVTRAGPSNLSVRDSTNGVEVFLFASSVGGVLGTVTNDPLNIQTNNTSAIFIDAFQNVGAGTVGPLGKIHVIGEILLDHDEAGSPSGALFRFQTNSATSNFVNNSYSSGPSKYSRTGGANFIEFDHSSGATAGDIIFLTAPSGTADAPIAFTERLRITRPGELILTTGSGLGKQAFTIDQNDTDKAFIDFQGSSAASAATNISTWTTGNSIQGFTRQEINGVERWMPFYDAPTS